MPLAELSRGAGRYILATPVGRVKEIKDEVLSRPGRYAAITPNLRAKEVIVGEGERRRRYILCLNAEEATREKRHRDEILDLVRLELDRLAGDHPKAACRLVASKRFGPYLSQDEQGRPYIDRAKVRRAEQLDGKFVLTTNDDSLSAADIALRLQGHVDHRGVLPQAEDDRPRDSPDVPLDAAADRGARQALRAGADDPAGGRDRDRGTVVAARARPRAPEGGPLHRRGRDHWSAACRG